MASVSEAPVESASPGLVQAWLSYFREALPRRHLWPIVTTVGDQGLVSAGALALSVLLARHTAQADYGVFVLAYSASNFLLDLQNSLLVEPMMVFTSSVPETMRRAYLGSVLALQLTFTGLLMAVVWCGCLIWWAAGGGHALATVALMPLGVLGVQSREFARKLFYACGEPKRALRNDALYVTVLVGGLVLALAGQRLSGATAFTVLGAAGASTAAVAVATAHLQLTGLTSEIRSSAQRHWAYGRWMIGVSGARWSTNELYYFVAAAFLGPAGSAALRAAQNVFAPVGLFLAGLGNIFLPLASRLAQAGSLRRLNHFAAAIGIVLGGAVLAYVVGVSVGSAHVFGLLYGGRYASYAYLLPLLGAGQVLVAAFQGPSVGLRALNQTRSIFVVTTLSAILTVAAVVPLTARWGLAGAVCAMLLSLLLGSPLWVVQYRRAVRRRLAPV